MKRTARLLCVMFLCAVYAQCQAKDSPPPDRVDEYVKREMETRKVPGLAFAVIENGRVIADGAYGLANLETGAHVGIDSVFELASVTKPITAVSVMMLVAQKKVALDDPVDKYLAQVPAAWHEITVRELLSHTSGLREYGLVKCDGSELLDISTKQQF